jgi:hypothetical protein
MCELLGHNPQNPLVYFFNKKNAFVENILGIAGHQEEYLRKKNTSVKYLFLRRLYWAPNMGSSWLKIRFWVRNGRTHLTPQAVASAKRNGLWTH